MRYGLTDFEWAAIRSFLANKPRGIPRVDDRRVLNGIFWVLRSGAPWHLWQCARALASHLTWISNHDLICPSCQLVTGAFACDDGQITGISSRVSRPQEGRIAIVTDVGCGMRWTCGVTSDECALVADGEVVWA
jgi:transposase